MEYLYEALATVIGVVLLYYVVPYIKSKTTEAQQNAIASVIETAVAYAQQTYASGDWDAKLAAAKAYIESKGYEVDEAAIEASVFWLNETINDAVTELTDAEVVEEESEEDVEAVEV